MGSMNYLLPVFFVIFSILSVYSEDSYIDLKVTHGPILGRPSSTTMSIWVRTNVPGEVSVRVEDREEGVGTKHIYNT